jgi:acetyl esterase
MVLDDGGRRVVLSPGGRYMKTEASLDPRVEESRRINDMLEELMSSMPLVNTVPPEETRLARAEGRSVLPLPPRLDSVASDRTIPGRGGDIGLRVFVPPIVTGLMLHIHGGGWVLGENWHQDVVLWELAQRAQVAVASVEYRLAPENPYPAGPDDCEDAAAWLVENAEKEFGTSRLLIGGESAGAHLSVVTLLRMRDRHGAAAAFDRALLTFGCYDLSLVPSVRRWGDRPLVLNTPIVEWFTDCFLPGKDAEARRDPDISPLYADLSGLCPALFMVGTADPLLDDTLFMEARWRAAGNASELHVYEEAAHGFILFPIAYAEEAKANLARFAGVD